MRAELSWSAFKQFPYERRLAKLELEALTHQRASVGKSGLNIELNGTAPAQLRRLTYFSEATLEDGQIIVPEQAQLEATQRNGRLVGYQPTRYSAHGLHDFKGKFNPQVVRAIGNIMGIEQGALVLDPFCGSGTTLLEAAHIGWRAVGLDLNPLAVLISNSKMTAFHSSPTALRRVSESLEAILSSVVDGLDFDVDWPDTTCTRVAGRNWEEKLRNLPYLKNWFPRSVLAQAQAISAAIESIGPKRLRQVFITVLSDVLRVASQQEPADLRIRRRREPITNYNLVGAFMRSLRQLVDCTVAARRLLPPRRFEQKATLADARESLDWLRSAAGEFDAVITSPPYATALPYIDTQRLSLALLGLVDARQLMRLQTELIGSREITERRRASVEQEIESTATERLGPAVTRLCRSLLSASRAPSNGFRRRNTPAVVYSYFKDMSAVFEHVAGICRKDATFALIVGPNFTRLGEQEFVIETPTLLAKIAARVGWQPVAAERLDAFPRFDMHSRNSIRSESLVILRRT